jgi:hypothetical protein
MRIVGKAAWLGMVILLLGTVIPARSVQLAGSQNGVIRARFSKADSSNYTETGDYSFDPTKLSFADWDHVTLYRNGVLVWGTEP